MRLKDEIEQLGVYRRLAYIDYLTGLRNRRYFEERIGQELSRAQRSGTPCSILVADIDDFKGINDSRGHVVGDRVLRAVGKLLHENQREMDTACRIGGDEFAVILPGTDLEGAAAFRDRLIEAQRTPPESGLLPPGLEVRLSFGTSTYPNEVGDARLLLIRADRAMYTSKRAAKGPRTIDLGEASVGDAADSVGDAA